MIFMKKISLFVLLNACFTCCFSQDNPYAIFGYKPKVIFKDVTEDVYKVKNPDQNSKVKFLVFDVESHLVKLLDERYSLIRSFVVTDDKLLRFLSVDPITKKYPELTPYQFASNTPIQAIDLDGLEGVVIGGADVSNTGVSETTKKITSTIQDNLKAANISIPVKSFNVPRSEVNAIFSNSIEKIRKSDTYKNVLAFIKDNYKPDQPLALYGYSYGGAIVDALQVDLFNSGFKVNTMVLVDANAGHDDKLRPLIMSNVKNVYNFFQDTKNLLGSRGFPAEKTFSKSPTVLNNYDLSKMVPVQPGQIPKWFPFGQGTNKHSNIDELTMENAIQLMTSGLKQ